jgi:SAM-dependent methyltransferase
VCNPACIDFVSRQLLAKDVEGKHVLEVGALDHNGSPRPTVTALGPATYIGVDIEPGPGVDVMCDVTQLVARFGRDRFSVVVATELVEHVLDWRAAINNLKAVLAPGGLLLITTRSLGYPYHGAPHDWWRFEAEDMRRIFADFYDVIIEPDPLMPGVFVSSRKPRGELGQVPWDISLHSMLVNRRIHRMSAFQIASFRGRGAGRALVARGLPRIRRVVPKRVRRWLRSRLAQ